MKANDVEEITVYLFMWSCLVNFLGFFFVVFFCSLVSENRIDCKMTIC